LVILGVWGAPGDPETLQKGGGEAPRPSEIATEAPGAAQTPKTTDFRLFNKLKISAQSAKIDLNTARAWLEGPRAGFSCLRARGPARGQENLAGRQEFPPRQREFLPPGREFPPPGRVFLPPGRAPGPEAGKPGPRAL